MNCRWSMFLGMVTAVATALVTSETAAFSYGTCGGSTMRWWFGGGLGIHRNAYSMPNGSARAQALGNALAQWNRTDGFTIIWEAGTTSGSTVSLSDNIRDVFVTPSSNPTLNGALGATLVQTSGCDIVKADTMLSDAMNFTQPGDTLPVGSGFQDVGWHATLHELGHMLGLDNKWGGSVDQHSTSLSIMRATPPLPTFGAFPDPIQATPAAPGPDDAAGIQWIYGGYWFNSPLRNVASTQTTLANGTITRITPPLLTNDPFLSKCRGGNFQVSFGTANTGGQVVTINHKIYIRAFGVGNPYDANGPGAIQISQWTGSTHNPGDFLVLQNNAVVPCGTPPGTYLVMHFADSSFQASEYNEYDNTSIFPFFLLVDNCGC